MGSLEDLLRQGHVEQEPVGLINGDTLVGVVRSDEEFAEKTFYFTAQGDVYFDDGEGQVFQTVYDPRRRAFVGEEARLERWRYREMPSWTDLGFDAKKARRELDDIAWLMYRRRFLQDETSWFSAQLGAQRERAQVIGASSLREALRSYRPSHGSVAPFGRETAYQELFMETADGFVPLDAARASLLTQVREILKRRDPKQRELYKESLDQADQILEQVKVGRAVPFENGKRNLASFLHAHGLNNGGEEYAGVHDQNVKQGYFWVRNGPDGVRVDVLKGMQAQPYVREEADVKGMLRGPSLREQVGEAYASVKRKVRDAAGKVRRKATKAVVGALIAGTLVGGAGGFFAGKAVYDQEEPTSVIVEEAVEPVKEAVVVHREDTYVVRPGDNMWSIAKRYADDQSNQVVLAKTDEVLAANGKLTIAEYHARKAAGEAVSKGENPNLIFPGQEVVVPLPDEITYVVAEPAAQEQPPQKKQEKKKGLEQTLYTVEPRTQERPSQKQEKGQDRERTPYMTEPQAQEQRSSAYTTAPVERPVDYVSVLRAAVRMSTEGASLQDICAAYDGFRDATAVEQALVEYQGYVQSGMVRDATRIADVSLAGEDLRRRMVHEYRTSGKSLRELGKELSAEYGVEVSAQAISDHARRELGVKNRGEAKATSSSRTSSSGAGTGGAAAGAASAPAG